MAFTAEFMMEWRVHREDAERPEPLRLHRDWKALLIFVYLKRYGIDAISLTVLAAIAFLIVLIGLNMAVR